MRVLTPFAVLLLAGACAALCAVFAPDPCSRVVFAVAALAAVVYARIEAGP